MKSVPLYFVLMLLLSACNKRPLSSAIIGTWSTPDGIAQQAGSQPSTIRFTADRFTQTLRDSMIMSVPYSLEYSHYNGIGKPPSTSKLILNGQVLPDDQAVYVNIKHKNTLILCSGSPATDGGCTEYTRISDD